MTKANAITRAQEEANTHNVEIAIMREGIHADEYAELDQDGQSYGYCPANAVPLVYPYGTLIHILKPGIPLVCRDENGNLIARQLCATEDEANRLMMARNRPPNGKTLNFPRWGIEEMPGHRREFSQG
jgi:hypothetical protein